MDRIKLLSNEEASASAKEVLDGITASGARVLNIFKAMANSTSALKTFFAINKALEEKTLDDATAERIAIQLANINGCEYCFAAHTYSGSKILSEEELVLAREGKSKDAKAQAALDFAGLIMKKAGKVSDDEFNAAKSARLSDSELYDIITIVALNFFTNMVNNVAQTKVDFPKPKI